MKKTTLTLITIAVLTTMASADGYNFASTQSVKELNATVQTATKDVSLSGNTLTFAKINETSSVVDLSSISTSDSFNNAVFDGATKKLTFTLGDGTTQEIDLAAAGSNLDTVTYDKPTKKLTFTLTDGNTADVILTVDKSDIGLSNSDNTSDADKPISTAVATALAEKKVVEVDLNANDEIVITYNDGTSKTL